MLDRRSQADPCPIISSAIDAILKLLHSVDDFIPLGVIAKNHRLHLGIVTLKLLHSRCGRDKMKATGLGLIVVRPGTGEEKAFMLYHALKQIKAS